MDYNQAIITTKFVIEEKSKVVYVYHSKEGWQFFGNEKDIDESDSRIVSLSKILSLNPHVEGVLWIPEDMEAWLDVNDNWQSGVAKYED